MRLHRFFVNELFDRALGELPEGEVDISDKELIHQWRDIFRFQAGDDVILLDNTGKEYLSNISELHKGGARLHIAEISESKNVPSKNITLYCSLIKKSNFELVLEKGTELGVSAFVPVLSERSEKKDLNIDRAKKIIKEASEQSGRGMMPDIEDVVDLNIALLEAQSEKEHVVIFDPTGAKFENFNIQSTLSAGIFIGPEGGWSPKELELFKEKNIPIYSLGTQILRAETAVLAISTLFLFP